MDFFFFSTYHTSHGKKYIALCVYSRIEPGSQMARAPTRTAETVGAQTCSIPLKIGLEVTVLKGHCHWYLNCLQYTSGLQDFLKVYLEIFKNILNLIFKRMIQEVHTCPTESAGVRIENLDRLNNETIKVSQPRW